MSALLSASGLCAGYHGRSIVQDLDLEVQPGSVVALLGPNGAGKTTLIDAITGFVAPTGGDVRLDGRSIRGWPVHRRTRAGLSRSFQSLELRPAAGSSRSRTDAPVEIARAIATNRRRP